MKLSRRAFALAAPALLLTASINPARAIDPENGTAVNTIIWKTAPGSHWDVLWLGDSITASVPYNELEVAPQQYRSLLPCGLPGNGIVGVNYLVTNALPSGDFLFRRVKPKLVGIMVGINDCLIANQASWLTPTAWVALYAQIVSAAFEAGAAVICETATLPENVPGVDAYVSTAQLQTYNAMVRGGAGSIHDQFYYNNVGRFAICDSQAALAGTGSYSQAGTTMDGVHLTPAIQAQRRQWWLNTIGSYLGGI
ncbi:GDSL-like Lipase/Acylhydrolase family protein [Rhizobiales bacterium GAS113]|nr:GDSL-like Lipase/Acylhydrolase family protein [Rhizobiales bacterium GAS113]